MNVDIFILARMGSSRFPGKVLKKIQGKPAIKHLYDRLMNCKKIRKIIVCTTNMSYDDQFVNYLEKEKITYFRGKEKDVLKRFLDTAEYFDTDIIIDVEGDKIFTDTSFVDEIAEKMINSDLEFITGNDSDKVFNPSHSVHGFIPAGIRVTTLQKICRLKKTNDTETGYKEFFTQNKFIKREFLIPKSTYKFPKKLRLFLDYKEDYDLAVKLLGELKKDYHMKDVLDLINKKPELLDIVNPILEKWNKNYHTKITNFSLKNESEV